MSKQSDFSEAEEILISLTNTKGALEAADTSLVLRLNRLVQRKNAVKARGLESAEQAEVLYINREARVVRDMAKGLLGS